MPNYIGPPLPGSNCYNRAKFCISFQNIVQLKLLSVSISKLIYYIYLHFHILEQDQIYRQNEDVEKTVVEIHQKDIHFLKSKLSYALIPPSIQQNYNTSL